MSGDAASRKPGADADEHSLIDAASRLNASPADAEPGQQSTANAILMQKAWKARNELYEQMFGQPALVFPKKYEPPSEPEPSFSKTGEMSPVGEKLASFNSSMTDQRIPVLMYPPDGRRDYCLYVTSGLSNPWFQEEPDQVSGFGCEIMVKAPPSTAAAAASGFTRWPLRLLRRLAYYVLSYSGTLSPGVILNMPGSLNHGHAADLSNLFIWYADECPDAWYELPSGGFGIFCAVGISEKECQFAEQAGDYGTWCIQEVLRRTGLGQLTHPDRRCLMENPGIGPVLNAVTNYADQFRPGAI